MSVNDTGVTYDGWRNLEGGMDSADADLVSPNQASLLVNCQIRDGFPATRPAFLQRTLTFEGGIQSAFEDGLFQGAAPYVSLTENSSIVLSVSGKQYQIVLSDDEYLVRDITPTDSEGISGGNPNIEQVWIEQAEDFAIIQDGNNKPVIWDGVSSKYAEVGELPSGSVISYGQGRVWMASVNQRYFSAGDLVFGDAGTATYNNRDAVYKWTENTYLSTGGSFIVPHRKGKITAMAFLANLDTALGDGPLIVGTPKGLFSVNTPIDRTVWSILQYPPQTIAHLGSGPTGPRQMINVNGDLWYRGIEGIYSFSMARRDFRSWINTPMSEEIRRLMEADTEVLLPYGSLANWNNYLLSTVQPTRIQDHGVVWAGLGVLDFAPISRMRRRSDPAWAGLWTGLRVLQVLSVEVADQGRCFLICLDTDDKIALWEIREDERFDGQEKAIASIIESRLLKGQDNGNSLKKLEVGALWMDRLAGTVTFTTQYRPDYDLFWQDWHTWSECANLEDCSPECDGPKTLQEQYRARLRLPEPDNTVDAVTGTPFNQGHYFQVRVKIAGHFQLRYFRTKMRHVHEDPMGAYPLDGTCSDNTGCLEDIFEYSSET